MTFSFFGFLPFRRWDELSTPVFLVFPGDSDSKESTCHVGDLGSISGLGRFPGEGNDSPLQFWPGEFHGPCRVVKSLDTTEKLSLFFVCFHLLFFELESLMPCYIFLMICLLYLMSMSQLFFS